MNSWQRGRREVLEAVAKIYDKIQVEVEAEAQDGSNISICRDQLQNLYERSAIADELERDIAALRAQNRESEANANHARLAEEKTAENIRLAKENIDLSEELKACKSALLQTQGQKRETSLNCTTTRPRSQKGAERIKQAQPMNQIPSDGVLTPVCTNALLSSGRVENGDSKNIALEKYHSLVGKYNLVFQNWTDIKAVRTQLETSLRTEKDKAKKYSQVCERLEKKLTQSRDKIQQLEERVRYLESGNQTLRLTGVEGAADEVDGRASIRASEDGRRYMAPPDAACPVVADKTTTTGSSALISAITAPNPNKNLERDNSEDGEYRITSTARNQVDKSQSSGLPAPSAQMAVDQDKVGVLADLPGLHDSGSTDGGQTPDTVDSTRDQGVAIKTESPEEMLSLHDTPVVVSERCIKKRKVHKSQTGATKIKFEEISSSPIGLSAFHGFDSHESLDLDDIGRKQMTPVKQRSTNKKLPRAVPYESRSGGCPARRNGLETQSGGPSEINVKDGQHMKEALMNEDGARAVSAPASDFVGPVLPRTSGFCTTKRRRLTSDLAIEELVEDGENLRAVQEPPTRSEALTPSDGRLVRLLETPSPKNRVSISAILADKGLTGGNQSKSVTMSNTPTRHASSTSNRPTLESSTTLKRGTGTPQLSKRADDGGKSCGAPSSTRKYPSRAEAPGSMRPLRSLPLNELSLGDFKVNSEYNHGYDYAFTDVVRNQDARRCLPGCTKPECCGGVFRALAEAAWDPNKTPTASQDEADTRILKEFLGDNAHKILNMTKAEKDEALLQAKTRDLANKHGRHRHAYERRQSPPGFWRVDFPSTQEERDDRQKIERHERDLVAQRYQEAMRPGGSYIFRDE